MFGLERFHYYAYVHWVTVETDWSQTVGGHLEQAPEKCTTKTGTHVAEIQKYSIDIKYVPGKDLGLADSMLRICPCPGPSIKDIDMSVHEVHLHLNVSATRLQRIQNETAKDNVLPQWTTCGPFFPTVVGKSGNIHNKWRKQTGYACVHGIYGNTSLIYLCKK